MHYIRHRKRWGEGEEGVTETQAKRQSPSTVSNQGLPLFALIFISSLLLAGLTWSFSRACWTCCSLTGYFDWGCIDLLPMKCARRLDCLSTFQIYLSDERLKELRVSLASGVHHGGGPCSWNTLQLISTTASPDRWVEVCLVIGKLG